MRLRIPRESFLVFLTTSTLYALLGGIDDSLSGGVVDSVALSLSGGVFFSRVPNEVEDSQRVLPRLSHYINIVCSPWGD